MIYMNMPLYIVAIFLILTLLVGVYFSKKKTTFREYAVGNKQFVTPTLVATVLATAWGAGGLIRNVQSVCDIGLFWIFIILFDCLGMWTISRLSIRMGSFIHSFSMADHIGKIYGRLPKVVVALVGICCCVVIITGQINVISEAISMCLDSVHPYIITVCVAFVLIFYSMFGGVRAITFTDILQFLTFSIIIPLLAWFMFMQVGKSIATIGCFLYTQEKFQFTKIACSNTRIIAMLLLILSFCVGPLDPGFIQRVYMTSGPFQARKVFSYASVFHFIIGFFIVLIGLFVFTGAPDLEKAQIWPYIMAHIPPFFKGFVLISLLAMAMSTADSCLNTSSIMVSHDIFKSLQTKKVISDAFQLRIARCSTLILGLLAMMLSFYCRELLTLMYWALDCSIPIVTAPFILSIFGFRGTSRTALIGMGTGALTILAWNQWITPSTDIDGSFIAMLANGLAMLAAHYLLQQPKSAGWVGPNNDFKQIQQARARKSAARKEAI